MNHFTLPNDTAMFWKHFFSLQRFEGSMRDQENICGGKEKHNQLYFSLLSLL